MTDSFRDIRKSIGYTQDDMATALGVSKMTIVRIEGGDNKQEKVYTLAAMQVRDLFKQTR